MLEGLHKYVAAGCKLPKCKAVDEATAKYREDMDIIGRFEKETVAFQPGASALGCEMYRKYADWCKSNNFFPANSRRFYSEFRKRHPELIERPIKNGAVFEGVGILVDGRYLTGEEGE